MTAQDTKPDNSDYHIDKIKTRDAFNKAATRYDSVAVLQREVGDRLLERLDLIRTQPDILFDIGSGTGVCSRQLGERYHKARIISIDMADDMLRFSKSKRSLIKRLFGKQGFVCGDAESLPFVDKSTDMIFSNLTLQWCNNLDQTFEEFHRVLKPGSLLMFSSLGPDTLHELRDSWRQADDYNHVNAFIDMHDVGDALLRAGFDDPVMDVERITLTYKEVMQLMRDLKCLGAHNVTEGRPHGLMGRHHLQKAIDHYETYRHDGLLPATYEVIYGHAWVTDKPHQTHNRDGVTNIPITDITHSKPFNEV